MPPWSDKHLELLVPSLQQLGRVGNKTAYVHLMCRTNHGNEQGMVRWVRAKDGGYAYDYEPMERYLDLVIRHAGKPRVVVFYVWEAWTGGGYFGRNDKKILPPPVTLLDPASGKTEGLDGPAYHEPGAAAFWRPVVEGLRERLKARGLLDAWHVGCANDNKPSAEVVNLWHELAPEAKWVHQNHGLDGKYAGKVVVGYNTTVWKPVWANDPAKGRTYDWQRDPVVCWFHRDIWRAALDEQAEVGRVIGEQNVQGMQNGFGRMSADFWACLKDKDGRFAASISARHQESTWNQCNIRMIPYLAPGPRGAISTHRFESVLEGVQECEARIFIEKALLDKARRARLGEPLAKRLQELLDTRTRMLLWGLFGSGWQARSEQLYAGAAEAAAALGPEPGPQSASAK